MQLTIDDVRTRDDGTVEVGFSTRVGSARGTWVSDRFTPAAGDAYHFEFTLDVELHLGGNLVVTDDQVASISYDGIHALLRGSLEAIDEDRVAGFRLAPDCLSLLELGDVPVADGAWIRLALTPRELSIYPYDRA